MRLPFIVAKLSILLFAAMLILPSCKTKEKPLTEEEVKTFVKELEKQIDKREASFLNDALDKDELIKRAGLGNSKDAKAFARGASSGAGLSFGNNVVGGLGKTGKYQLVKTYKKDEKWHAIFRLYADGGLNYHDMELNRHKGSVGIADVFIYTVGENFSKTIASIYHQMSGLKDQYSGDEKWVKSTPEIKELIFAGKYEEANELFQKIPADVRKGKIFQVMNIQICSGLDMDTYKKALDEFQVLFANEPNMHLVLIDAFILNKEYDKAIKSINLLDKMIDKDPFLDFYRYLTHNAADNKVEAKKLLLETVKHYPDFGDAQLELIATYLEEGDYTAAKPIVEDYQSRKTNEQETLSNLLLLYPDYK